eukprot:1153825-Pelagomonas_calceolata.AAC.2
MGADLTKQLGDQLPRNGAEVGNCVPRMHLQKELFLSPVRTPDCPSCSRNNPEVLVLKLVVGHMGMPCGTPLVSCVDD